MCGIAGFIGFKEDGLIERMIAAIRHRGPDAANVWSDPVLPVALGHARLSILDLSEKGRQPMWDDTGRFCITYNGEIYNYRELRHGLEARGAHFRSSSDTEVLVTLFREKGPSFLADLRGIWAFAIWDTHERQLFVSRDPLGVKPLYYIRKGEKFLFASEIKGFLSWTEFPREVDNAAVFETLIYLWTPGPRTMFRNVKKLAPGESMTVRLDRPPEFFSKVDNTPDADLMKASEHEIIERLQSQLYHSVQSQLVSDVPVGAFLSGGLDSSSVVAMAEREGHTLSRCYTMAYAAGRNYEGLVNDLPYARRAARHLGVECVEVALDSTICDRVCEMLWHLDEPQADIAPLNVLLISEAARANGDYVLLSGAGGDDIFSGYRRHVALQNELWWDWLPRSARKGLRALTKLFPAAYPFGRRLQKLFAYADLTPNERLVRYFAWVSDAYVHTLFSKEFSRDLGDHDPFAVMYNELPYQANGIDPLSKMLILERRFFLVDHNLNYTDKMGMARGVEIRVPLIDIDLMKLVGSIPSHLKLRGTVSKYLFKRAMEPFLPEDVIYRPKSGFVAPVREWVSGPLRTQIRDVLSPAALSRRGWFSPASVQVLLAELDKNRQDIQYLIWSLYMIELWARLFIDGEHPDSYNPFHAS